MEKAASTYIKQILDAIILLEFYVAGSDLGIFLQDAKTQDAVAMGLQFIAELQKNCRKIGEVIIRKFPGWKLSVCATG